LSRTWGYPVNPSRVKKQLKTGKIQQKEMNFAGLITQKIEATIITLEKSIRRSDKWSGR
jgi:hypothetical protein